MQTKYFVFTRHLNHGSLDHERIQQELQPLCSFYSFQTEVCPNTGRDHVQGYLCLSRRSRAATLARIFPSHLEPRKGTHAQATAYTQKEETRKPGTVFVEYGSPPVESGSRTDLTVFRDAILEGYSNWRLLLEFPTELAKYPKFVHLVRTEKLRNDVFRDLQVLQPRLGWQWSLAQQLAAMPNPRTVIWRWEPNGNVGKSYFALHYEPGSTFICTGGKHADIHYAYQYEKYVIFDWSRCNESTFPYGLVEQFKNGYFLSTKYESTAKRFNVPHVVVFANFAPDVSQMSLDRWDIEEIQ